MNYPIDLTFKLLALASQIYIRDANGHLIGYVKQKLLKLKEDINVFADEGQTQHLFNIRADRILDFSANYRFTSADGQSIGSIRRRGMRSIFRANYEISDDAGNHVMSICEENAWIKFGNALIGELPIIGMFTGYFLNPAYIVSSVDGTQIARLAKQPAFLEGRFQLTPTGTVAAEDETRVMLSVLTMTLLERSRG